MEKPAAYDYVRIRERSTVDRDTAMVMHDRMMFRESRTRSDQEEADEHAWRGDHAFSADAAAYSLSNFIEPEVKKKHPDWTMERVHEEAMNQFEKRLQQDLSYEKREAIHEETTVRWEIRETSPGMKELATQYGDDYITLRELWEHTREFAEAEQYPDGYNAEEAKAQLAMQDAFIRGEASGFVSILSHPDSIRYVQVWEPSENGSVVSKQIDLFSTTGRDFSAEESIQLIEHVAAYRGSLTPTIHRSEESTYAHFFVSSGARIREEDIRTIAVAESFVRERIHESFPLPRDVVQTPLLAQTVARDVIGGARDMMALFGSYLEKKIHPPTTNSSTEQPVIVTKRSVRHTNDERMPGHTNDSMPETSSTSPLMDSKDTSVLLTDSKRMLDVMDRARRIPVGPIAFLAVAAAQSKDRIGRVEEGKPKKHLAPLPTRKPSTERNEQENHPTGEVQGFWETVRRFIHNLDAKMVTEKSNIHNAPDSVGVIHAVQPEASASTFHENPIMRMLSLLSNFFRSDVSQESPRFTKDRSIRIRKSIGPDSYMNALFAQKRTETFTAMTKRLDQGNIIPGALFEKDEHLPFSADERDIGTLLFAYVFWISVRRSSGEEIKQSTLRDVKESGGTSDHEQERERTIPWILLAIIWKLSMMRESGKSQYAASSKKGTKTKSKSKTGGDDKFPDHGIIFLAVLHDRMKYIAAAQADARLFIYG